jgi:hypothetical protein
MVFEVPDTASFAGIVTVLEYVSGMFGGYMLGSMTDVPRLLFRPVEGVSSASRWDQVSSRLLRLHQKSLSWGTRYESRRHQCVDDSSNFQGFVVKRTLSFIVACR